MGAFLIPGGKRLDGLARATILIFGATLLAPAVSLALMSASSSLGANTFTTPRTWYFLHNSPTPPTGNTTAVNNLTMTATSSTQATLFNYDTAADSLPGRRLLKSGTGPGDATLTRYVNWQTATLLSALTINGAVVVRIWSGITGFPLGQQGVLVAYLRDYNPTLSTYAEIANATLTDSNWQQGSATWVLSRISVNVSNYTVPIGHRLEVKLETTAAASADMVVAYDTTVYPSSLGLP